MEEGNLCSTSVKGLLPFPALQMVSGAEPPGRVSVALNGASLGAGGALGLRQVYSSCSAAVAPKKPVGALFSSGCEAPPQDQNGGRQNPGTPNRQLPGASPQGLGSRASCAAPHLHTQLQARRNGHPELPRGLGWKGHNSGRSVPTLAGAEAGVPSRAPSGTLVPCLRRLQSRSRMPCQPAQASGAGGAGVGGREWWEVSVEEAFLGRGRIVPWRGLGSSGRTGHSSALAPSPCKPRRTQVADPSSPLGQGRAGHDRGTALCPHVTFSLFLPRLGMYSQTGSVPHKLGLHCWGQTCLLGLGWTVCIPLSQAPALTVPYLPPLV